MFAEAEWTGSALMDTDKHIPRTAEKQVANTKSSNHDVLLYGAKSLPRLTLKVPSDICQNQQYKVISLIYCIQDTRLLAEFILHFETNFNMKLVKLKVLQHHI